MDVDFGVQVIGPFEGEGEVAFAETPAGEVASTAVPRADRAAQGRP